jgi:transcription-repair coupling factor (superfamily II helicase)
LDLSGLLTLIQDIPLYQDLLQQLREGDASASLPLGLISAARPYVVAALHRHLGQPIILLTARPERVRAWTEQLAVWLGDPRLARPFPPPDGLPYERVPWARETVCERISALTALTRPEPEAPPPIVVASARALMQKTLPPREFRASTRSIRLGQIVPLSRMLQQWVELGYQPERVVEEPGTFSRRGGLVDVFPPNLSQPVRVEFFGDEIDSLRRFDPATQRSDDRLERFALAPASEALTRLSSLVVRRLQDLELSACHPLAEREYRDDMGHLESSTRFQGIEFWLPYFYSEPGVLTDYLPANGLLVVDDWQDLRAAVAETEQRAADVRRDLLRANELPPNMASPLLPWDDLRGKLTAHTPLLLGQTGPQDSARLVGPLGHAFAFEQRYGGQLKRALEAFDEHRHAGQRVIIVTRQAPRLAELLDEREIRVTPVRDVRGLPAEGNLTLVQGTLEEGWILCDTQAGNTRGADQSPSPADCLLHLLTDAELFGWTRPVPRRARRPRPAAPERFFADVQPGDYVVHVEHGIGLFQDLVQIVVDGGEREYLLVEYAAGDKLYVPIYQADRLSRYVGTTDLPPHVNRLGTAEWERIKERTKKAVSEIADDLLELYAAREVVPGHAFAPDTLWQAELEASFPYIETEAQLQALDEIKADMEKPLPMDRLVCGDVGYGKTEVALRAAFKAVMDGKQAALLVPTTVLAQQHLQTFEERLKAFPIRTEMLSRFRTSSQQADVLDRLAQGNVDIVIGTHRLLSNDVVFKDLGLLIIDEEQRFGVGQKEKLKQMRTEVDVLTLTATPIPRTLHMSLTGVRDMSTIDTPPEERLPIRTYVADYDENLIRQAIRRELERGGQVYFVHNRIMGIYPMANRLRKLVPEARIAVGHGQMPERELEGVMSAFIRGEIDILVSTSIIESGLDIPNVNTLVVNRADMFGLAQLYQLRGRVGRGARRAYAYFLHPRVSSLSEAARARLSTIAETTELGAGFRIAMRDLEIRGAGELLGARQHGHITAVGFDLYVRLLAQAVQQAKAGQPDYDPSRDEDIRLLLRPLAPSVQINLPMTAHLPEAYVPDAALRLQLYRRLAGLTSGEELEEMQCELADRFGPLPEEAENLFFQLRLKLSAVEAGVSAITVEEGQVVIRADSMENLDRTWLQRRLGNRARVSRRQMWLALDAEGRWRTSVPAAVDAIQEGLEREASPGLARA